MEKVTLVKVYRSDTNKEGVKLVGKNGKPYTKIGIKTKEYGDKWLNGFGNFDNKGWNEGDTVDIITEQNGDFLNFKTPSQTELLEIRVKKLEDYVFGGDTSNDLPVTPNKEPEINVEDIPF